MANRDLENYVTVNDRIAKFRDEFPEGAIVTNREADATLPEVGTFVRFKASVFRDREEIELYAKGGVPAATGHAELMLDADKITEKCESIAVGRALAILGYEIQKAIASADEMESYNEGKTKTSRFSKKSKDEDEDAPLRKAKLKQDDEEETETKPVRKSSLKSRLAKQEEEEETEEASEEDEDETAPPPPKKRSSFRNAR